MAKKKRYLTATLPDGYVKTIGPTSFAFTHYWRIVAHLDGGRIEVFWGHEKSLREATAKSVAAADAAKQHGRKSYDFDIVELTVAPLLTGSTTFLALHPPHRASSE